MKSENLKFFFISLGFFTSTTAIADDIIASCNTEAPEYVACSKDTTCNWNVCFNQSKKRQPTFRNLSIYGGYGFPGSGFIKQDYNTTYRLDINNENNDYIEFLAETYLGELGLSMDINRFSIWTQYRWRNSKEDDREESGEIFGNPNDREFFFDQQYEIEFGIQPNISLFEALSYFWPKNVSARNDGSFANLQFAYRNTDFGQVNPDGGIADETELERFRFTLGSDNFYDIGQYSAGAWSFSPSFGFEAEVSLNYDRIEVDRGFEAPGTDEGFGWGWSLAPYVEVGLNDLADMRVYYEYELSKTATFRADEDVPGNPEADGFGLYSIKERNEFLGVRITFNLSNIFD